MLGDEVFTVQEWRKGVKETKKQNLVRYYEIVRLFCPTMRFVSTGIALFLRSNAWHFKVSWVRYEKTTVREK